MSSNILLTTYKAVPIVKKLNLETVPPRIQFHHTYFPMKVIAEDFTNALGVYHMR